MALWVYGKGLHAGLRSLRSADKAVALNVLLKIYGVHEILGDAGFTVLAL